MDKGPGTHKDWRLEIMIDYIEGLLEARDVVYDIDSACLNKDYAKAIELCEKLTVVARMLRNQLMIQSESK
jgi:hypothetical protein